MQAAPLLRRWRWTAMVALLFACSLWLAACAPAPVAASQGVAAGASATAGAAAAAAAVADTSSAVVQQLAAMAAHNAALLARLEALEARLDAAQEQAPAVRSSSSSSSSAENANSDLRDSAEAPSSGGAVAAEAGAADDSSQSAAAQSAPEAPEATLVSVVDDRHETSGASNLYPSGPLAAPEAAAIPAQAPAAQPARGPHLPPLERVDTTHLRLTHAEAMVLHRLRDTSPGFGVRASLALEAWVGAAAAREAGVRNDAAHVETMQCGGREDCRLVRLARAVPAGEALYSIPRSVMLDTGVAFASRWTALRHEARLRSPLLAAAGDDVWLAVFLIYDYMRPPLLWDGKPFDYGPPSYWAPFYASLPLDFPSVPAHFSTAPLPAFGNASAGAEAEAAAVALAAHEDFHVWLRGSPTLNAIQAHVRSLGAEHAALVATLADLGFGRLFSRAQWNWARGVVATRAFNLNVSANPFHTGGDATSAGLVRTSLVPLADMLNHAPPHADTTWALDESPSPSSPTAAASNATTPLGGLFRLTALRDLGDVGAEVSTTYGPRSNRHLLVQYGFALEHNPHDEAILSLRVRAPPHTTEGKEEAEGAWDALSQAERDDRVDVWKQRLRLLQLLHAGSGSWTNSSDIHASPATPAALASIPHAFDVHRCAFSARVDHAFFTTCSSFARVAVASHAELLHLFTKDLPACPSVSFQQPPLSYSNELRAARYLRRAALEADAAYAAAPFDAGVQDERARLLADRDAQATRMCDEELRLPVRREGEGEQGQEGTAAAAVESAAEAAARRVQSGCLTANQRNMLLVRLGERSLLRMHVAVADAADLFESEAPRDLHQALGWLAQRTTPQQKTQAAYVFIEHILLPLYIRERGWTIAHAAPIATAAKAEAATSPAAPIAQA